MTIINPFGHHRVAISDFVIGEKLLQHIFQQLQQNSIFALRPNVIMHPMNKWEGGLVDIEINAFKDLAMGGGARNAVVYEGSEQSISELDFDKIKQIETI